MPKDSINVYLTAVDKMSPALASITDKTKALDKESQELQETFEALQKANKTLIERKTELQKQLKSVNEEVKEARKNLNALGDEASSDAFNEAVEKQQKLRNEIAGTTKALQENQKMYKENIETIRKGSLESAGEDSTSGLGNLLGGLGIGQQLSSLTEQISGTLLTSALGDDTGNMISGALGSAISGAALGTAIAPGIGTVIGGALGGLFGLYSGAVEQWESRDEVFKDYYGGLYEDVSARSGEMVASGSTIAGGREQTFMALAQRFGSEQGAADYLSEVEKLAANTNYDYDEIVGYTKLLLNSYKAKTTADADGNKETDVLDVLMTLSDATAGLDLSSSDVNMMISGLSRMRTTGKATQEYLNYFRERGVDVDQALADDLGVDKSAIADMVTKGKIGGEDAAQAILDFIQQEFGGLSDTLAGTYDAMVDNLGDINASLEARGGDAYNTLRKEGVEAEMNALGGALGDAIGEINAVMGENQARRENMQEQYMREALEAVLLGQEGSVFNETQNAQLAELSAQYAEMKARYEESGGTDAEAGAQMERLYEEAQALGQAYFDNSDFVKMLNDTELDEIEAIRENTAGLYDAINALYEKSQELSKGFASISSAISSIDVNYSTMTYTDDGGNLIVNGAGPGDDWMFDVKPSSHAYGLDRVPYDEYPALLHEGERVLTASEARSQDTGQAGFSPIQITITGNSFTGTPEEMADQLAEILVRKISQAVTAAAPK